MAYLLDTDIWSYFLQGRFDVAERIDALPEHEVAISRVSVAELQVWALGTDRARRLAQVDALARRCRVVDVDQLVWALCPFALFELKRSGRKKPMPDVLIGCSAAVHGMTVVSNNVRDFESICDVLHVPLETWAR